MDSGAYLGQYPTYYQLGIETIGCRDRFDSGDSGMLPLYSIAGNVDCWHIRYLSHR